MLIMMDVRATNGCQTNVNVNSQKLFDSYVKMEGGGNMRIFKIDHIIDSLHNGQFKQAKEQIQHKCKTKPEVQARKLAQVCSALIDPEGFHNRPDLAESLLNMFDFE